MEDLWIWIRVVSIESCFHLRNIFNSHQFWTKKLVIIHHCYNQHFSPKLGPGWATIRPKRQFVPCDNSSQATIRPKRQFVPSDNSSQATIRPKRQFVPSDDSSQATIRPKRQFVPSDNSSQATIRPKRQFVPNNSAAIRPICKKRQFVPNCLIDQLITNLLKVETKEIIKPTTNEFIQTCENN